MVDRPSRSLDTAAVICDGAGGIHLDLRCPYHVKTKTAELRAANIRLQKLAIEDALTEVANRRSFDEALRSAIGHFRKSGQSLSLIMLDLDYFKQLNDTYGHQRGDQCLIQVAATLRKTLLMIPGSLVARYGGEEFAILLSKVDRTGAMLVAEELRQSIYELALEHEHSPFEKPKPSALASRHCAIRSISRTPMG